MRFMPAQTLWERYQVHLVRYREPGVWLDISRMRFGDGAGATDADPGKVCHVLNHLAVNSSAIARSDAGAPVQETFQLR